MRRRPPLERFQALCAVTDGCWLWQGTCSPNGYGRFRPGGSAYSVYAHRWSYEHFVGPIDGRQLDHLCRVRRCVNPDHLEPVTQRTNLLRGNTIPARHAARTHCDHGHEFTPENTTYNSDGTRRCRTCKNAWQRAWYHRKKEVDSH